MKAMEGIENFQYCFYSLFLGLFFILIIRFLIQHFRYIANLSFCVGPQGFPILGNALEFCKDHEEILPMICGWWKTYSHQDFYKCSILNQFYIIPCRPKFLEKILNSSQHIEKSDDYAFLHEWIGTGLLTSSGEKWRKRRKLLTPAFHFRILDDFIELINEQSEILIVQLEKENQSHSFDIFPYITRCTLDIICETAMGCRINAQNNKDSQYVKAVYGITEIIHSRQSKPWLWSDWIFSLTQAGRKHKDYLKILHEFTYQTIQNRKTVWMSRQNFEGMTSTKTKRLAFLDLLLDAAKNEHVLSNMDIREEVDTFMFEGHDTTAAAIAWTLYLLGRNPDVQEKVQQELNDIFGQEKRRVTSNDLKKMRYLECVIKESLRLFPPVPIIARKLNQTVNIDNHRILPGTILFIFTYMIHRDPEIYADPEKFDPDRFLLGSFGDRHPYGYIPFSAGPRNCIGQKFALMEVKIVLAHLFRSFQFTSLEKEEELKLLIEIILRPKSGIIVNINNRNQVSSIV